MMAPTCIPSQRLAPQTRPELEIDIAELQRAYQGEDAGIQLLRHCLTAFAGQIAVVSSFGAQSAVLLASVAEIAPATPVVFIDTGMLFAETLQYRQDLTAHLGLLDVRDLRPSAAAAQVQDPRGLLHQTDADSCCAMRKITPLELGLAPFAAWVNGRRRTQAATRVAMPLMEAVAGRVKINPLAQWDDAQIEAEIVRRRLPRHPLVAQLYPSIGCRPCTRPVAMGHDPRSGRWAGTAKTECGIHRDHAKAPTAESATSREYISLHSAKTRA